MQHVHQTLDDARGIRAGNIAVQPALSMRDHRHGIARATYWKTRLGERFDERRHFFERCDHELDIRTGREAHMTFTLRIGDVAQLADRIDVHLALRSGANRVNFIAIFRNVTQNARPRPFMPSPIAIVLAHHWMHILQRIGNT